MYDINNDPLYAKKESEREKLVVDEERTRGQFPFPSSSLHQKKPRELLDSLSNSKECECMLFACRE